MFNSYASVMKFLDSLGLFHMDLSLERVQKALHVLDLQNPPFKVVQIVGTNGKGSTATFLESIASAHGLNCGLFTSPHFISPRERVLCAGKQLDEEQWRNLANVVHAAAPNLTYFEFITVLSLLAFVENKVDLAIFEAGLGGKYDSTSAIARHVLCLSPISLDHESILGNTLSEIAKDKCAAITSGMHVYHAVQESEVMDILQDAAKEKSAKLIPANLCELPSNAKLGLYGKHQETNALLALSAWQGLSTDFCYNEAQVRTGLKNAFIAGRMQSITTHEASLPKHILLDGAHNEQGLDILIDALNDINGIEMIIFSCMVDKNILAILPRLRLLQKQCNCPICIVSVQDNARSLDESKRVELVQLLNNTENNAYELPTLTQALNTSCAKNYNSVLICGSLYLLGEFFEIYPHYTLPKC